MPSQCVIRKNSYYDSVTLMSIGSTIKKLEGIQEAVVAMATDLNKEILRNVGLASDETEGASPNDFIIAISGENEESCNHAATMVDELLKAKNPDTPEGEALVCNTIKQAVELDPAANIAVISIPGSYAAREAMLALKQGLHVMLFSDNVSIEDEKRLKEYAVSKGLLVMGPDCGTASIQGIGLCFANKVKPGKIGLVAASGTGLQEVMVQIDHFGGGISQAIGTGGRDLSETIGGATMLQGIQALAQDDATELIVVISKPPADLVARKILKTLGEVKKPSVVCFLEGDTSIEVPSHISVCDGLYSAAKCALRLAYPELQAALPEETSELESFVEEIAAAKAGLNESQTYVRGFFCGGTLCAESVSLLRSELKNIKSNVSHRPEEEINGTTLLTENALLDMGDDEFTNGKPHPMIDPELRNEKITEAADDPSVGVILLDFEIGFGSHPDPAGIALTAIDAARVSAKQQGRELVFVGYVCGTELDAQGLASQNEKLKQSGVIVASSNRAAAKIVAAILK